MDGGPLARREKAGEWLLELEDAVRPGLDPPQRLRPRRAALERRPVMVGHSCVLSWWEAVKGGGAGGVGPLRPGGRPRPAAADMVVAPTRAMLGCAGGRYGPLPQPGSS